MTTRVLRLAGALCLLALVVPAAPASAFPDPPATPQIACGPGSLPESGIQGRVPKSEVDSGRAAKGYRCNTEQVGHFGATGGFQVHRYVDKAGRVCAYFDSTLLFPKDALTNSAEGLGVYVMDMANPAKPVHTATLSTPAMLSPHESLRLNQKRGLLAAGMGYPSTNPGIVDVYDVSADCRQPVLKSSTPLGIFGHESAFSPDGKTFYVTGTAAPTLSAVDLTDPARPSIAWLSVGQHNFHGMSISDDGNRLYAADAGVGNRGLTILDVSQVQKRVTNPSVPELSHITWPTVSIPQNTDPITIKGKPYLLEIDEYTSNTLNGPPGYNPEATVGAARMIDISDEKAPKVVSDIRLEVNQTKNRAGDQRNDPGASSGTQGYAGHYCSVPTRVDPPYAACSFIVSGLRVFDIRDPHKPREIAYFNGPIKPGSSAFAMSAPTFVPERNEIWYTDGNSGFYVVRLTASALAPPAAKPPVKASAGPAAAPPAAPSGGSLPTTGLPAVAPYGALALAGLGGWLLLRRRA